MNPQNKILSNSLYLYTLFIMALIVGPFIPIVSFLFSILFILLPFYIISLILIYKRSKYAIIVNQITLLAVIFLELFYLYSFPPLYSQAPKFIIDLVIITDALIIIISLIFLIYLQYFKRKTLTQIPTSLVNEKVDSSTIDIQDNKNKLNSNHIINLFGISLLSCGMFTFTGFGFLVFVPTFLFFSIFYSVIFTKALKKNNPKVFAVYAVAFTLVFSYISIVFNAGIMTDGPSLDYLAPLILGVPSTSFGKIFNQLHYISLLYLLLSIPFNLFLIRKNASKMIFSIIPFIGLILIAIHWGIIWNQLPELRAQIVKEQQNRQQKEQEQIEKGYSFNWLEVNENTFKNRTYSIFTPPAPLEGKPKSECPYTIGLLEQNITQGGFDINCLNNSLKSIGQMPITKREVLGINIFNSSNTFKKGDTVVVVAELENPSMMRVNAKGNAAKDCSCRMPPYDYSDVVEYIKTSSSTGVYERSVVQMQVTDKKRTVMMLYPININKLKDINIKLSQFSNNPNIPVTLKEVAVLSPIKLPKDPEWLNKWLKEPNPFLTK